MLKKIFSVLKSKPKVKIDKVILGIGNPGKKYAHTRHNLGFEIVDCIAQDLQVSFDKEQCKSLLAFGEYEKKNVLLAKPLTFVNLSGEAAKEIISFFALDPSSLLVIVDDIHLNVGKIRFRLNGSSGGHNGLKSIIRHLGTENFPRLRVGIGSPQNENELVDHVLSRFSPEEMPGIENAIQSAKQQCKHWLCE